MAQTRLSGRQRKGRAALARAATKNTIVAAFAHPATNQPALVPSPPVALAQPPAAILPTRQQTVKELAAFGIPSPYALQPRGGSKYAPGGPHTANARILQAAMPRTMVRRSSRKRSRFASPYQRLSGRGDYWADIKKGVGAGFKALTRAIPQGTFQRVGGAIGGALGQSPGAVATGGAAGNLFSKLVGFGDYNVVANSLATTSEKINMGQPVPQFGNISNGTVIQHREYIKDIIGTGSVNFSLEAFSINPGLSSTFPWLSALASNYEQYEIRGMVFEYKSMSSDSTTGAASALGSIILATDYDSVDSNYPSKNFMEQSQYCTSGKPSSDIIHPIECAPNRTSIPISYVRGAAQPVGTDIRLYDLGKFQIATSGIPALTAPVGSLLGELWVTYEIVLYKPQIGPSPFQADHFNLGATWGGTFATCFGTTTAIAVAKVPEIGSSLGFSISDVNVISVPRSASIGRYMMHCKWLGGSTALANALVVTLGTGLSALNIQVNNGGAFSNPLAGETAVQQWVLATFQITAPLLAPSTLTISAGTLPGAPVAGDLFICRLPNELD